MIDLASRPPKGRISADNALWKGITHKIVRRQWSFWLKENDSVGGSVVWLMAVVTSLLKQIVFNHLRDILPGMDNVSLDMIWKRLEDLQTGQAMIMQKTDALDHKIGALAQTLLGVQRDVRQLSNTVETLATVVNEHTHRLDRIETRLGLVDV